jgi:hypothetical protein
MVNKRWRFWVISLSVIAGGIVLYSEAAETEKPMSNSENGLELLRVELPDGQEWALGKGAVGRPFIARLLLINRSDGPLRIWDPLNSEGNQCVSLELTDQTGQKTVLRMPAIERSAGVPTVVLIEPNEVVRIDNELLRANFQAIPRPGSYTLTVTYENMLDSSGPIEGVWTGRLTSPPQQIQVFDPCEAKNP